MTSKNGELTYMAATKMAELIRTRRLSPVEVVDHFSDRIDKHNSAINGYVTLLLDQARERAQAAEKSVISGGELGPLHGVPIAIKDLFDFKSGVRSTFGSKPFADFVADSTSTYVQRLEDAGAIILGKTNTPEFGHKGVTDNYLFGPTSTPFDLSRNSGGSSGGSAAAVAAGLATVAQGSDGGGSIRIPASFCGLFGLKASYGRVAAAIRPDAFLSHTPFIHAGPLTRSVADGALMVSVMCGPDPRDPLCLPDDGTDWTGSTSRPVRGLRIAFSPDLDVFPIDPVVAKVVKEAVTAFENAGAVVEEVTLGLKDSHLELASLWTRQIGVLMAEIAETLKAIGYDIMAAPPEDIAPQFRRMIEVGRRMSAVEYKLDDVIRTRVYDAIQNVFDSHDLLITPTLAVPPVKNASDGNTLGPTEINGEEVEPCIGWCLTYPINFTGNPSASVPAGLTPDGLPVGLQIIGRQHDDATVLAASAALEAVRPWHHWYRDLELK